MFKIRIIQNSSFPASRERLEQVRDIFRQSFPAQAGYADRLPSLLNNPLKHGFTSAIFVAENQLARINAFALFMHFPECGGSFLDFIAVRPGIRGSGLGGALYEAVREYCQRIGSKGLFLEVQPDDPQLTPDPGLLKESRRRIRFYERYGARPIWNTDYSRPVGDPPTTAYLLYDGLGGETPLSLDDTKKIVRMILTRRFGHIIRPALINAILKSFTDDPVVLRPPRHRHRAPRPPVATRRLDNPFALVSPPEHNLHHVTERGYFEKPIRVDSLLEILRPLPIFTTITLRAHGEKSLLAVHDHEFVRYLRTVSSRLKTERPVYPDTFPIRRPERRPKELPVQAGFYCLDSGTPLHHNAYIAAINAVDCALTAADELLAGRRLSYAVCRPPGHHAGKRFYGGFCYFNNAAIAAHRLSGQAKTAVLDIDYHHGNGTQDIFYDRDDVLTVSLHGHPDYSYPYFSGYERETGTGAGLGHNFNFPLKPGCEDAEYIRFFRRALNRIVRSRSEILIISLGFDIIRGDPTGSFNLSPDVFNTMGRMLAALNLPLLVVQEGGYNIRNIKKGAASFFSGLSEGIAEKNGAL